MLEVERLCKRLGDFEMRDVSFSVDRGEYFVMLGESGAGKTVVLETLTGVLAPDSGRVLLNGRDITNEKIQERKIGLVFQGNTLFPHLTVRENIAYGPRCNGVGRRDADARARQLAASTGVEDLLDRMPASLSGGEAQRVALARSLATDPDCLLLDEPICSLDSGARAEMRRLLRELNAGGMTMVHVTHDYEEAVALATRIGVMDGGRIVQIDTPREILLHPRSEFVASFTGIRNLYRGRIVHRDDGTAGFEGRDIRLQVRGDAPEGEGVVWFGSEDVAIAGAEPSGWTGNVLSGTIAAIHPARRGTEVVIDAGAEVSALVTPRPEDRLELAKGLPVVALVATESVRILGR